MNAVFAASYKSPIGPIFVTGEGDRISGLSLSSKKSAGPMPAPVKKTLDAYFDRIRLPKSKFLLKGTVFQRSVWSALAAIPRGETISYKELAKRVRRPRAVRAVAAAVGANPVAILLPCHRVIGSDGSLTGFAYGLKKKAWLLKHEQGARG
jgi:methylated-DNA-[protein]-cysteine S-methyltransferase